MLNFNLFSKVVAIVLSAVMAMSLVGCTSNEQQQISQLLTIVGNSVGGLLPIIGINNPTLAAKLQSDFGAASTAVLNWKPGTTSQDVQQALNLVITDINLIPTSTETQSLVLLAITTVQSILALLPQGAKDTVSVKEIQKSSKTITSAKEYKKRWNAIVYVHPTLSKAKL
jgi:hypothetical protein